MKKIIKIQKAKDLYGGAPHIQDITIEITDKGELEDNRKQTIAEVNSYFYEKAKELSMALLSRLPQGLVEPLIIQLLIAKVSSYFGPIHQPGDSDLLDMLELLKKMIKITFFEYDGTWRITYNNFEIYRGNTLREALINMKIDMDKYRNSKKGNENG